MSKRIGDIFRATRGTVTGARDFFVLTSQRARELDVEHWCSPVIASAREIIAAQGLIRSESARHVLLDARGVDRTQNRTLDVYLSSYEEQHHGIRPGWWRFSIARPPAVATYTGNAPSFATNPERLAVLNIAYALTPRYQMTDSEVAAIVAELNEARRAWLKSPSTRLQPRQLEELRF
jgi:hypothetical protein